MSRHATLSAAAPLARRQSVLSAAVSSLLEQLETRSHFSVAPVAAPGGAYTVTEGHSVLISGLGSTDSDGTVRSYQWDTNYDANKGFKTRLTTGTWTFNADTTGSRTIALRVTDNTGDVSTIATTTINVTDVAPTLTLTAPSTAAEGTSVAASWSYTDPSAADVVTGWSVDWGDGSTSSYDGTATGSHHVYDEDGSYTIALTATQANQGNLATTVSQAITVTNVTPLVTATAPRTTLDEGETAIAYFSSPNRGGSLDGWTIDWGDGQVDQFDNTRSTAHHVYADNGNFAAIVSAQEPDGGSGSATINYSINNVAPTVTETNAPTTGLEGSAITVNSTVTDPGVNDTQTYGWTVYRDGTQFTLPGNVSLTGQNFTFTPTDNGNYVVRLTVTDNGGGSTTVNSDPIIVANVAPTATITGTPGSAINEGDGVNLTAVPADVGADDTLFTYAWSVTKGGVAFDLPHGTTTDAAGFHFVPTDNGSYIASVIVKDKDLGSVSVSTAVITVNNVAPTATVTAPTTANEGDTISATSTVTDPGSVDTQGYAWTVEKMSGVVANGTGTFSDASNSLGTATNVTLGTQFSVAARLKLDPSTFVIGYIAKLQSGSKFWEVVAEKSGSNVTFFARTYNGSSQAIAQTTVTDATLGSGFFDLAFTADGPSGVGAFYLNGNPLTTSGAVRNDESGSNGTLYVGAGLDIELDHLAIYGSALSAGDVSSLAGGTRISAVPVEQYEFDDAVGSSTAVSTGSEGSTLTTSHVTFTNVPAWTTVTLPLSVVTNASTLNFVPTDNGTYRVKLTVTDDDGGTSTTTGSNIVVANVAPTGVITGDASGNEGAALNYSVAGSDVGSDDVSSLTYAWSVTKGGVAYTLPNGTVTNAANFSFTPDDNAAYVVSVTTTDKDGGTSTATQNVTVANVIPDAAITGASTTGTEGTAITLGSTATDASAADTTAGLTYLWTVAKDGVSFPLTAGTDTASGLTFTPTDNGSYVVSLVVSDKDGGTKSISTAAIVVANANPTATVTGEPGAAINEGDSVALTAAGADAGTADVAGLTYAWTIKKDNVAWTPLTGTVLNTAGLSFVPTDNGSYVATVTVTDKDGGFSRTDSLPIVANNVPPTAAITGAPANSPEGTALVLASTVTDPGAVDTQSYVWSVTKGGVAVDLTGLTTTAASFNFTPRDNGAYVVSLLVTDKDGGSTTTTSAITVTNVAPAPTITGDSSVNENAPITLNVAANDVGVDDTQAYLWSVTKNGSAYTSGLGATNASTFTFTPNLYGTYVVTAQVTDNDGGVGTVTKTITVNDVPPTAAITGMPSGPRAEGSPITLHGTGTDVPAENGLTYTWAVTRNNGDVFTLPVGTDVHAQDFTFTPTHSGMYKAVLTVTDSGGQSTTATTSNITVTNALPAATISGMPSGSIPEGTAVTLHTSAQDPGAEDLLFYAWTVTKNGVAFTLPGGTVTNAANFTFTPNDNGTWVATCAVTDDDGGPTSVNSGAITVTNVAPTVAITRAASGAISEGDINTYTANVTDPGSADTFTYQWTATKNGQSYALGATATQQNLSFVADDQGVYTLSVVVTDKDTATGTAATGNFTVLNANPTVTRDLVDATGTEGQPFTLDGNATDPGVNDVLTYVWTITKPDTSTATVNGKLATFTPADNGTYFASLTVTDADGGTRTGTLHTVVVANAPPTISSVTAPTTGNEGSAYTASVSATDVAADAGSLTYAWTVTKGGQPVTVTNSTASSFTFTPTDDGSYALHIVVTDKDGGTTFADRTVAVANVAPTVAVTGDTTGNEGSPVSLTGAATDISSVDQTAGFTYAWTVTKNGLAYTLPTGTVANAATLTFTPENEGTYVATVTATDKDGGHSAQSGTVIVANVAPTVSITGTPSAATDEGTAIALTGVATDPGTQDVLTYSWAVTKGGQPFLAATTPSSTGQAFSFTPTDNGSYVATLTVSDGTTTSVASTTALTVNNVAPTGTVSGPSTGSEGSVVTMTATAADAGSADVASLAYAWTVTKDGNAVTLPQGTVANTATFAYTPLDQGAYVLTCTVTDKDGASTPISHNLAVSNVAPSVAVTGLTPVNGIVIGSEGTAITVGSTVSDAGVNDVLTYGWTVYKDGQAYALPNGTVVNGHGLTFTPSDNGSYVIRLTVNDQDGGSTTVNTQAIAVANVAPAAAITGDTTGTEGQAVSLTSTASDVGPDDQAAGLTYAWTVTRGNTTVATGSNATLGFTPTVHGTYNVTLAVTDKDGSTTTKTSTVNVANLPPANLAITGSLSGMNEGQTAAATIGATDASGDTVSYAWQVLRGQAVFASGTGANVGFIAGRGNYTLTVTATDTANAVTSRSYDFTVANIAPTAALTGPTNALLPGATASFGLTAADVPANQALSITWDYGDGSTPTTAAYTGNQSLTTSHAFATHGTYTVTATINDGADSTVVTKVVTVTEAMMVTDPMNAAKTALMITGGAADDVINVSQQSNGKYAVTFNGTSLGTTFAPTGRIYVYGNGGSNTITVDGTANAVVVAGTGASSVTTGAGNDIIVGSPQADRLNGGDGRDIIIGGNGADLIHGNAGDDLEVAGGTAWMNDLTTLNTVFGKWSDSTQSATLRRTSLQSLFSGKLVIGDTGGNQLFGETGNDWMVINSNLDKIKDLQTTDLVN